MSYLPSTGSGSNVQSIEFSKLNAVFPASLIAGNQQAFLAYQVTDANDTSDLLMLSLEIKDVTGIGSKFNYALWTGNPLTPNSTAQRLFSSSSPIITGGGNYNSDFTSSATAYILNNGLKTGIYLVITNLLTSQIQMGFKLNFLKIPPVINPVSLPDYAGAAFVYTGTIGLNTAEVGPGQTFPEIADAIPNLAPGFTINVHPGTYFKPFRIPPGMDGWTIQAAPGATADDIICNGRGGWLTGYPLWLDNNPSTPVNPYRLKFGKAFALVNSPGTIRGLGFWYCGGAYGRSVIGNNGELNLGQGEAGIYAEGFISLSTLTISHCTFDGNANGIFTPHGNAGDPAFNVILNIDHCDFSAQVQNGATVDGLSHNVYISNHQIIVDTCNFYDCNGNSFKSRSPNVAISNSFLMQGAGRAIDFPDGGLLAVSNSTFSQKAYTGGGTRIHNFIGIANESSGNGRGDATFTNCTVDIAYEATFLMRSGSTAVWTTPTINWYSSNGVDHSSQEFTYDVTFGSETTGVSGLGPAGLTYGAPVGTTFITGWPARPPTVHLT